MEAGSGRLRDHEDAEIYINGVPAATYSGYTSSYDLLPISAAGQAALRPGTDIATRQAGGQYIDMGFAEIVEPKR